MVTCVMGEPVASEPRLFVGQVNILVSYVAPYVAFWNVPESMAAWLPRATSAAA